MIHHIISSALLEYLLIGNLYLYIILQVYKVIIYNCSICSFSLLFVFWSDVKSEENLASYKENLYVSYTINNNELIDKSFSYLIFVCLNLVIF